MSRRKGIRPEQYAGPFQEYSNIPQRYRLETYTGYYQGDNTWEHYCDEVLFEKNNSAHMRKTARIAGQSWCEFMDNQKRHHALATPQHVEQWCQQLLDGDRNRRTCYEHYFVRILQFYDYLKKDRRHPHLYNPLLLAAIEHEFARKIWMFKIDTRPEVVGRE